MMTQEDLAKKIIESEGVVTEVDELNLEKNDKELASKVDRCKFVLDQMKVTKEMLKAKAKVFTDAARVIDNEEKRLKDRLKESMREMGTSELLGNDYKFTLAEVRSTVDVYDEGQLPPVFMTEKITMAPDKDAIRQALESSQVVNGARLLLSFSLTGRVNKKLIAPTKKKVAKKNKAD